MRSTRFGPADGPSIHQSALENLRRGSKVVGIAFGALFVLMGLFVVAGLVVARQSMPAPPSDYDAQGPSRGHMAPASAGPTDDPSRSVVWREQLVAFLAAAQSAAGSAAGQWLPGAADASDRFTYTPLGPGDPGSRQSDGTVQVPHVGLAPTDVAAVLKAVSRNGSLVPSSVAVSTAHGTDRGWTLQFVVKDRRGTWVEGEAMGYRAASGRTVILRTTYGS